MRRAACCRPSRTVVLGFSRLLWVGFYPRQTLQSLIHGLEAAFRQWGGVPRELLFDQLNGPPTYPMTYGAESGFLRVRAKSE